MNKFLRYTWTVVPLFVIAGSIYGILHRQQILDYLALRNYTPNHRVISLADDTSMNSGMRKVFYINHPDLEDKTNFRKNCPSTEQSIVLGCYVQRDGIFLLDVTDQRLNGVIQVTAAHEALHAQYDRLSRSERTRVNNLTQQFFDQLDDPRIKKTVEQYRSKDPSVVPNELHSILGTEVRHLSPELEAYYGRYFNDRSKIVGYSEKYENIFVSLNDQVDEYDSRLRELKVQIESNQKEIEGLNTELEQQKERLDNLSSSGRTEAYNSAVPQYNAQVNSYNQLIATTRNLINQYNGIVEKRNAIATAEQELIQSIDSNSLPKQAQ